MFAEFVSMAADAVAPMQRNIGFGAVKPPAYEELPIEKAAEARERSRGGHVRGKIVLKIK